jgi:predicted GTPase
MKLKDNIIVEIKALKDIIIDSKLIDNKNIKELERIESNIIDFKIYLPLVGNFNAGKSSILNTLLEKDDFLSTDIIPKTAVATEIIYSVDERVEVYSFDKDEIIDTFASLGDLKDRNIDKNSYIKVYRDINYLMPTFITPKTLN